MELMGTLVGKVPVIIRLGPDSDDVRALGWKENFLLETQDHLLSLGTERPPQSNEIKPYVSFQLLLMVE